MYDTLEITASYVLHQELMVVGYKALKYLSAKYLAVNVLAMQHLESSVRSKFKHKRKVSIFSYF